MNAIEIQGVKSGYSVSHMTRGRDEERKTNEAIHASIVETSFKENKKTRGKEEKKRHFASRLLFTPLFFYRLDSFFVVVRKDPVSSDSSNIFYCSSILPSLPFNPTLFLFLFLLFISFVSLTTTNMSPIYCGHFAPFVCFCSSVAWLLYAIDHPWLT